MKANKWLNSHDWKENIEAPTMGGFDAKAFQLSLDKVVGTESDGTKRWRLVWGCDRSKTEIWDRYREEYRPRYAWRTVKVFRKLPGLVSTYQTHEWVCVPRWFIECLVPSAARDERAEEAGVEKSVINHPNGRVEEVVTAQFSERRVEGADYMLLTPIYEHSTVMVSGWRSCCLEAQKHGYKCFGLFRQPDQKDLDHLSEAWADRVAEHNKPGEMTEEDRAIIFHEMAAQKAQEKAEKAVRDQELRGWIRNRVVWEKRNLNPGTMKGAISLPS